MATLTQAAKPAQSSQEPPPLVPNGPVTVSLKFFAPPPDGSKPFNYPLGTEPPEGYPLRNFGDADIEVTIQDIRGRESLYNLDENAFTAMKAGPSNGVDFTSDESIKTKYYPEMDGFLRNAFPQAERVFVFDHTVRPSGGERPPVLRTHIDQSPKAALGRVRSFFPVEEADRLVKQRVRIINVWRPLNGPVRASPLAFADSRTVADDTLHVVEHRYADRTGETLSLARGNQQWCYWSGIGDEERLLLQIFDSEKGARLPHTAFEDPRTPVDAAPRESIEVRALVFG